MVAGHSLGEYSALVAAGALAFEDGLRLVRLRGELMQKAGEENPGTMAAVVGLDAKIVGEVCLHCMARGNCASGKLQFTGTNCDFRFGQRSSQSDGVGKAAGRKIGKRTRS